MADDVVTQEGSTAATTVAEVAAPVFLPITPKTGDGDVDPKWLAPRLEQARRSMLKEIGVENLDEVKALMAEIAAKREATKSAEQKSLEVTAKLEQLQSRSAKLEEVISLQASGKLALLSDEQRNAVKAIAGDDSAAQLKAIEALGPTWSKKPVAATTNPPVKIADTAPSKKQPEGSSTQTPTAKDTWESLKTTNPILADRYLLAHQDQIFGRS